MLNPLLAKIQLFITQRLNRREQIAVYVGSGLLVVFVVVQLTIVPLLRNQRRLEQAVERKYTELSEMHQLRQEYDILSRSSSESARQLLRREKDFTLFSFLDRLAGTAGVKDKISYMRPTTTSQPDSPYKKSQVEMKLQQITMEQLARFLHGIETSRNMIVVKRLSVSKQNKAEGAVTVVIQTETLES